MLLSLSRAHRLRSTANKQEWKVGFPAQGNCRIREISRRGDTAVWRNTTWPKGWHRRLWALSPASPLCMTQYGHPNSPDKGALLQIIGSHSHVFSVMFQTVCLWSCLNVDDNICVSNDSQLLSASENAAQHLSEVCTWGGCCAGSSRGTMRSGVALSGTFCSECAGHEGCRVNPGTGPWESFQNPSLGRWCDGKEPTAVFYRPSVNQGFFFFSLCLSK